MAPQLQINQGPQDALLYDNTRSYFTNVGYARTSNFQMELQDVDPQGTPNLGTTVQFVIPKAADLLGPVDLLVNFETANAGDHNKWAAWVEALGYAMIDRVVFSIGSQDIETITGDNLAIMNELYKAGEARMGRNTVLKTGRAPVEYSSDPVSTSADILAEYDTSDQTRVITHDDVALPGAKLIIPLGLFFTKHPGSYFPLGAIAGCNDVRISVKLKPLADLVQLGCRNHYNQTGNGSGVLQTDTSYSGAAVAMPTWPNSNPIASDGCKLRCHMIHVTGPEATTLMNKEHVRLLKLWQNNMKTFTSKSTSGQSTMQTSMELSFLHPVQELIVTIRKVSEMGSSADTSAVATGDDQGAMEKNYFAYHGGGDEPNIDALEKKVNAYAATVTDGKLTTTITRPTLKVDKFKLKLNGQERHSALDGLDRHYLMNRLMPMLHSGTGQLYETISESTLQDRSDLLDVLEEKLSRKEIYVIPFALNPEGANPSGAVNFSKVSHAKLEIFAEQVGSTTDEYQVDVYGVYYNWLQIKDGRALISFA